MVVTLPGVTTGRVVHMHWLTRSQVARRLGKSVATVRRLESRVLHPKRGRSGTWLFDSDHVERLARSPELARGRGRSKWFERRLDANAQGHGGQRSLARRAQNEGRDQGRGLEHREVLALDRILEDFQEVIEMLVDERALTRAGAALLLELAGTAQHLTEALFTESGRLESQD
jgi:hypothetical protein